MRLKTALFSLLALVATAARPPAAPPITVYLVGDSTMSIKEPKAYPETGWGMPFAGFFDETVRVDNRAKNGRSTRSFVEESRWQPVAEALREGDYVLIQFGHNDEVPTKKTYTPPAEYQALLRRFVAETRAHRATPVLLTPVARRKFDAAGQVQETHADYAELVRQVAREQQVPLLDLDHDSQLLLQQLGPETSKLLFNYLAPGEHPNYPDGKQDDTHFNELGARRVAELVLAELRAQHLPLAGRTVQRQAAATVDPQAR
ncbi:rhamnogalacturonan acetylesterase [Hymenobacter sp. RP-2-7]|uniref:Rhamnogalacturonan acetylesterase n=1 Tax=Hymenobacter polaris TaxID=2682546 RepID=A0A7Y0AAC2_9BACT|nr:rhamnogalacturonan acetylesterase [Hymenobacter polaris]NML63699.1 rhamnogalacturonan acetylesterase [Hymenobacter polaris]